MNKKEFQEKLLQLRNYRSLNSAAKGIGIHYQTLQKYENGDTLPPVDTAADIANYYGVSVDWLLGIEKPKNDNEFICDISKFLGLSKATITNIYAAARSSEADERELLQIVDELSPLMFRLCGYLKYYGEQIAVSEKLIDETESDSLKGILKNKDLTENNKYLKWCFIKECEKLLNAYIKTIEQQNPRPNDEHSDGE